MKKYLICLSAALVTGCSAPKVEAPAAPVAAQNNQEYFGDTITADGAIPVAQLPVRMEGRDSLQIKLSGKVVEVCQKKGCWMDLDLGNNQTMRVRFRDYGFFVPKDAAGKEVVIDGMAFTETTSVQELKHYAEDAGKTQEEIEKITGPETSLGFEANGVILKK